MDTEFLKKMLSKTIRTYRKLGLTRQTVDKIILDNYKAIIDSYNLESGKTITEHLQNEMNNCFNQYIKKELEDNNTYIISRYMDKINRVNYTYETREKYFRQFNKIDILFSTIGMEPSVDIFLAWLKKDKRMEFFVEDSILIGEYKLNHKVLSTIYQSKSLPLIVEAFCILKSPKLTQELNEYISNNYVRDYFEGIEERHLTSKEKYDLMLKARSGDKESRDELLRCSLKKIARIAYAYNDMGVDFLDLIQEGSIGLLNAIDRYDEEVHTNFDTYSNSWIMQAMLKVITTNNDLRYAYNVTARKIKIENSKKTLVEQLERMPTDDELAAYMNMTNEELQGIKSVQYDISSLDEITTKEYRKNEVEYPEICEEIEELTEYHVSEEDIMKLLNSCLKPREVMVIAYRNGLGGREVLPCSKIGEMLKITRARVDQIERRAMKKILKSPVLDCYVKYMDYPDKAREALNEKRKTVLNIKTIYDIYPNNTKEDVDLAISKLGPREQELLRKKYGTNLELAFPKRKLTKTEHQEYYSRVDKVLSKTLDRKKKINK